MTLHHFFDGTYADDEGNAVYNITTLRNPAGLILTAVLSGSTITLTVDDLLEAADRLKLREQPHRHLNATNLTLKD